jgi:hypothetical protein
MPRQFNLKSIDKRADGKLMLGTSPKETSFAWAAQQITEIARIDDEVAFDSAQDLPLQRKTRPRAVAGKKIANGQHCVEKAKLHQVTPAI